ncbi:MAG: glycosyltransferase [Ignavibacteriales bacterium]|nr:glycosyltransferase [Ignavibacteriales bacterium]
MNKKRICLVTSGHPPFDERIFWKFGQSLNENGFSVSIICSTEQINKVINGISIVGFDGYSYNKKKKIDSFYDLITDFNPDIIICSEMLPVFAALKFKGKSSNAKIILDVTEWFPENVAYKFNGVKRWIKYFQLLIPYFYVLQKVDHLIIGEVSKKKRYDLLARSKPKSVVGYYPVLKYFNYKKPDLSKEEIIFGYAGVITFERGINKLLQVSISIADKFPQKKFKLLLFGRFTYQSEEVEFKQKLSPIHNVEVVFVDWTDYDKMSTVIEKMDICFDLRERNFIYSNSLPIKIFEYMACGKPFIYSDIKPIRDEIDYEKYGFLVNPDNESEIINAIESYLSNPKLVEEHSINARKLVEENKNWENESKKLIEVINKLLV